MNERIKALRKALGLTQQAFADKLGIRQNTIAKYETGRGNPTVAVVSLICREFDVNEIWLRHGIGDMFIPPAHNTLDALAAEYHLSAGACALIRRFLELDEDIQQAFVDYAVQVANDLAQEREAGGDAAELGEDQR